MITSFALGLALIAPQKAPTAPLGQWGRTGLTATALATRVDNKLATLTKAMVNYKFVIRKATFGQAQGFFAGTIVDSKRFSIEVPRLNTASEAEGVRKERWIADGRRFGYAILPGDPKPGPMASRPGVPAKTMNAWFANFSKVIFAGVGQATHPFSRLVADAGREGYKVVTEQRRMEFRGQHWTDSRMVMTKGKARYEIVVDDRGNVPTVVSNVIGMDYSGWLNVDWSLKPGKALNPNICRFTKAGPTTNIVPAPRRR